MTSNLQSNFDEMFSVYISDNNVEISYNGLGYQPIYLVTDN